jgi:outer membrane protein assembly factor BamB
VLTAQVTANLIVTTGSASITVVNPGGTSNAQTITIAAPSKDATAYQINPAHTGAVSFENLALPTGNTWSVDVGGAPSYGLIVGGKVLVTVSASGNTQLLALNAASGATLWGPIALTGQANVAYDGGRLFVITGSPSSQVIAALDPATGNSLWSFASDGQLTSAPCGQQLRVRRLGRREFVCAGRRHRGAGMEQQPRRGHPYEQ